MALAARYADWPRMLRSETAHVHLGTLLFLVILWLVRATFGGASLHFLGIGGLTLSAGPALALVGGAVVVAGTTALRHAPAANAGLAFLSLVAVPVFVQWAVLLLVRRALPRNPFAWFFVVAFLGGGASFFAGALAGGALGKPLAIDWSEYALITLMLAFGEGTLTGMLLTLGVVYRPAWVATFEDRRDLEQI
jgi:uncharacterized membrane protein